MALGLVSLLGLSLLACGSNPKVPTRQDRALEAAKRCAKAEPHDGVGVHGSPLVLERGRIKLSDDSGDVVYFPEQEPRGSPMGLTLHIEAESGQCKRLPI